jgi:hypothetical protein
MIVTVLLRAVTFAFFRANGDKKDWVAAIE